MAKKKVKIVAKVKSKKATVARRKVLVKPKVKFIVKKLQAKKPQAKRVVKKTVKKVVVKKIKKTQTKQVKVIKEAKKIIKELRPKVRPKQKKKKEINVSPNFSAESFFKAKIKVIGIGGGGGSIVSEIGRSISKATFVVADSDLRALKKRSGIKYFWFGQDLTHGLGTGVNPEIAKTAAERAKEKIAPIFKDQDIIIFVACLGGGMGSGATQIFADMAKDFGGITFGIFTLPFKFEGKNKTKIAYSALKKLRESLNVSITIPNEKIFKVIDADTPITQAFSMVNKNLIESLESLIDLIYNPGVINIDFADLRTILKGRGNLAFLNTLEESGKSRADKISEKILHNDLYQNNNFIAEKILFNIAGGPNLSMVEVEKISRKISERNPQSKIIFGISNSPKLKNKIKTTLLMTGSSVFGKVVKPETKFNEEVVIEEKKASAVIKKPKKIKKKKQEKQEKAVVSAGKNLVPVFNNIPVEQTSVISSAQLAIMEEQPKKKTIRRTAIEAKKIQETEENKRFLQEEEWEIPAFLRRGKI